MPLRKIVYITVIFLILTACGERKTIEEKILSDIFPQLVDSLHIKWRPLPPPPPPPIFDKDSNFIGIDSIKMGIMLAEHQMFLDRIDSIDSRLIVGFSDSYSHINWDDLKFRINSNDSLISSFISLHEKETNTFELLNPNQISIDNRYKLILKSEIVENYSNIWSILKDYKFVGMLNISKIYLSSKNDLGLLQVDYYTYPFEGYSYYILIERSNKEWHVRKLLENWVSPHRWPAYLYKPLRLFFA